MDLAEQHLISLKKELIPKHSNWTFHQLIYNVTNVKAFSTGDENTLGYSTISVIFIAPLMPIFRKLNKIEKIADCNWIMTDLDKELIQFNIYKMNQEFYILA